MATTKPNEPPRRAPSRRDRLLCALFWDLYLMAEAALIAWLVVELLKAVHS
jgi:hypothetical protein